MVSTLQSVRTTYPWPTFLMVAYMVDGSSELTTERSFSIICASLIVLMRRSTCLEGAGFGAAAVGGLVSVGLAREADGAASAA